MIRRMENVSLLDQTLEKRQNHSGRKIDRSTRPLDWPQIFPNRSRPSNGRTVVHSGSRSHYAGWRNIAMFLSKIRERKERSMPGIERRMNDAQEPKNSGSQKRWKSITGTITCIRTRNEETANLLLLRFHHRCKPFPPLYYNSRPPRNRENDR